MFVALCGRLSVTPTPVLMSSMFFENVGLFNCILYFLLNCVSLVSLLAFSLMFALAFLEFFVYRETWMKYEYEVDKDFTRSYITSTFL